MDSWYKEKIIDHIEECINNLQERSVSMFLQLWQT